MRIFMQTRPGGPRAGQFYQLILQEDLLGGWTLVRQWGSLGQRGSSRQHYFDDRFAAQAALEHWRNRKQGEGYEVTFVEGEGAGRR